MNTYYIGDKPTNYVPFDQLHTIQHFIVPNFATMDWDKIGHENALRNLHRLDDDTDPLHDNIMLYIHVPYCLSLCHYCNFNKFAYPFRNEEALSTYVDYVIKELDSYFRLPYIQSRRLTAVYLGVGARLYFRPMLPRSCSSTSPKYFRTGARWRRLSPASRER